MKTTLTLAYSTCPNDTFIFHALAHGLSDTLGLSFDIALDDVETLNQKAVTGYYDVSKLSFAAIAHLRGQYALLKSGAALGRGCGPLVIAPENSDVNLTDTSAVAIPGKLTTASLLLELYLGRPATASVAMAFDKIMPALQTGRYDFGVIIHEGRFTYPDYQLRKILDLGDWWENETGMPIPLGGIGVKRDLPRDIAVRVEKAIANSVAYAMHYPEASRDYIRKHAQELDPAVIDQHIALYVNAYCVALGATGADAVKALFRIAESRNIINGSDLPIFATD